MKEAFSFIFLLDNLGTCFLFYGSGFVNTGHESTPLNKPLIFIFLVDSLGTCFLFNASILITFIL